MSVERLIKLMVYHGNWSDYWILMLPLLFTLVVTDENKRHQSLITIVICGFFLWRIAVYTLFRSTGIDDSSSLTSGNRVLTLIVPVIAFYITSRLLLTYKQFESGRK